jgi:Methyltransferase domain
MDIYSLYRPFHRYFRSRRMKQFIREFKVTTDTRVLDIGGMPFNWTLDSINPVLTFANLSAEHSPTVVCDARHMPFKDGSFDIVYSNSVIEHVGGWDSQRAFASECRRVGERYYVQTPNKWFPIEPHWVAPFIHWMPQRARYRFARYFTVRGILEKPSPEWCRDFLEHTRLLTISEVRRLFPDGEIWRERLAGLTKSIIAVKR